MFGGGFCVSKMKKAIKRIFVFIMCIFTVACINFALPRFMPGDPVLMLTGTDEDAITQAQYDSYKEKLGLNDPLSKQFSDYICRTFTFDLGYSYHYEEDVTSLIAKRIPNTLSIALPAVVISSVLAMFLGCNAGYRADSKRDFWYTLPAIFLDALPSFLVAMLLVNFLAFKAGLFPLGGLSSAFVSGGVFAKFADRLKHLFLPVTTMVITSTPSKFILMKNSAMAAKDSKYVLYLKARGISEKRIKYIHIFKNTAQPFISAVGLNIGFILSGSMVIESVFSIKGMGSLFTDAIFSRDFPVLQGCLFITSLMVVTANALTDAVNTFIDPKTRFAKDEK